MDCRACRRTPSRRLPGRRAADCRRKGATDRAEPASRPFTWSSASSAALRAASGSTAPSTCSTRRAHRSRRRADDRPAEAARIAAAARTALPIDRRPTARMNILFIGDIVGRPGRDLVRKGLRGARRALRHRSRHRERGELGRRVRHHARHRRHAARMGRRRDDVGQSHLGQEGSARLHRHRAAAAAAGELPCRRAGTRIVRGADAATAAPSA